MSARCLLALVMLCTVVTAARSQTRTVAGVVVDRLTGLPIPAGEARLEEGRTRDHIRPDGVFVLRVPADRDVAVVFRCPGYVPLTVTIRSATEVVWVALEPEALALEGVAAAPEGGWRHGAVLTRDDVTRAPASGVPEGLAGKLAGVEVQANSGTPGGAWAVRLRGISSLLLSSSPLYVVDGVVVSDASISSGVEAVTGGQPDASSRIVDLVAGDIESVEVLRGAAASLYGSRGAGGVVVIRTRRGRSSLER